MIKKTIGVKLNQTSRFNSAGKKIPVTRIVAGPVHVVDIKTEEKDGYFAIQLGFGERKPKNITKPILGHFKKAGLDKKPPRFLKEVRLIDKEDIENISAGDAILLDKIFQKGDLVSVSGVSKGKGFQGVVKRHGFAGGPRTHGQSDRERAPGSIGQTTTPGRVYKGKKMAGRMGGKQATVKKLKVVKIDEDNNILTVKGLVPGGRNNLLVIERTYRKEE